MPNYTPYYNQNSSMFFPNISYPNSVNNQLSGSSYPYGSAPVANQAINQYRYMPAPQTQQAPIGLTGRVVNSIDEITPQEVPMDGNYAVFPLADGTAVCMKAWGPDGTIKTLKYIPEAVEVPVDASSSSSDLIMDKLNSIENMLKQRSRHRNNQNPKATEEVNDA